MVCVHDDTVDRTTNGRGAIDALTLPEMKLLDAGSWFDAKFRNERIPTFEEVAAAIKQHGRPPVLIAGGQVLFKLASRGTGAFSAEGLLRLFGNPYLLAALALYGFGTVVWIHVPTFDTSMPAKNNRAFRCRSDRNVSGIAGHHHTSGPAVARRRWATRSSTRTDAFRPLVEGIT